MANMGVTYKVVGRCLKGNELEEYVFVGSDNSQLYLNKERTLYMIGRGLIENMRVQTANGEVIIRGKGVNLTNLPAYDKAKQCFRNNEASKIAANSGVQPRNASASNNMSQLELVRRIMMKRNCVGYEVRDMAGNTKLIKMEQVKKLASEKRLSNAVVNKCTDKETGKATLFLRGVDCRLKDLPILLVDAQGKIIDPNVDKKELVMRAAKMKRSGIITHLKTNKQIHFNVGDFLVCKADGSLTIVKGVDFLTKFQQDTEHGEATCDYYLDNILNFSIELFGSPVMILKPEQVLTWIMVKRV